MLNILYYFCSTKSTWFWRDFFLFFFCFNGFYNKSFSFLFEISMFEFWFAIANNIIFKLKTFEHSLKLHLTHHWKWKSVTIFFFGYHCPNFWIPALNSSIFSYNLSGFSLSLNSYKFLFDFKYCSDVWIFLVGTLSALHEFFWSAAKLREISIRKRQSTFFKQLFLLTPVCLPADYKVINW